MTPLAFLWMEGGSSVRAFEANKESVTEQGASHRDNSEDCSFMSVLGEK